MKTDQPKPATGENPGREEIYDEMRGEMKPAALVSFCDSVAKQNSEALSFIPRPKIEQYAENGQVMVELENDEPCGFLIFGAGWPTLKVYQACICYDARRQEHGLRLVKRLVNEATRRNCEGIALKCATDLEANTFWREAGFSLVGTLPGGLTRNRTLNCWYLPLWPLLIPCEVK